MATSARLVIFRYLTLCFGAIGTLTGPALGLSPTNPRAWATSRQGNQNEKEKKELVYILFYFILFYVI